MLNSPFSVPFASVSENDIASLVGQIESHSLEIKQMLPTKDGTPDRWSSSTASSPGDYAKFAIFKALCAFANADGGVFILGVNEIGRNPARIGTIAPIPRCKQLMESLLEASRDWIEPPVPGLMAKAIPTSGDDGVVVFMVAASSLAPHRLANSNHPKEAYRRSGWRSPPLSFTEIKAMAIQRYDLAKSSLQRLDSMMAGYATITPPSQVKRLLGFQIAATPVFPETDIGRAYLHPHLFVRESTFRYHLGSTPLELETIDNPSGTNKRPLPILRGGRRRWNLQREDKDRKKHDELVNLEIFNDGSLHLVAKSAFPNPPMINLSWILADFVNVLRIIERIRTLSENPGARFLLRTEIRYDDHKNFNTTIPLQADIPVFKLGDEESHTSQLATFPTLLPTVELGDASIFSDIVHDICLDLYNILHDSGPSDFRIHPSTFLT